MDCKPDTSSSGEGQAIKTLKKNTSRGKTRHRAELPERQFICHFCLSLWIAVTSENRMLPRIRFWAHWRQEIKPGGLIVWETQFRFWRVSAIHPHLSLFSLFFPPVPIIFLPIREKSREEMPLVTERKQDAQKVPDDTKSMELSPGSLRLVFTPIHHKDFFFLQNLFS